MFALSTRDQTTRRILTSGLIAIVRLAGPEHLARVAQAIGAGGIDVIEFTMNTPGALDALKPVKQELGDAVLVGAGTVRDPGAARRAIDAGAAFIISPNFRADVVAVAHAAGKVAIPGAFTPTEIAAAADAGADFIKLFPANTLGPDYIKAVLAPLAPLRLVPTGGVRLENLAAYLAAGASALALGGSLVDDARVAAGDFQGITEAARRYRERYDRAREDFPLPGSIT